MSLHDQRGRRREEEESRQQEPEVDAEAAKEPAQDLTQTGDQVVECEKSLADHAALCEATDRALRDLLAADKYLADIPYDISHEEVQDQIAVLKGQSITVFVKRESLPTLRAIVPQSTATVLDLKQAIVRTFDLDQKRRRRNREHKSSTKSRSAQPDYRLGANISWRYIWRTYLLVLDNGGGQAAEPLLDDRQLLSSYGVINRSVLRFVKRAKLQRQRSFR